MRISAVIQLARRYMALGTIGVIILISIFLIGYFLVYKKLMKGTKKLKVSKVVLWSIFFIYMMICQYKCNSLYLCFSKDLRRCFISKTLARSIVYYIYNYIKFILCYCSKIKFFRIKFSY